jgi:hypothetical protein
MSLTEEECSICLEKLENEIAHLSCNHFYHYRCICQWINNNIKNKKESYCPICNQSFEIINLYLPKKINTININNYNINQQNKINKKNKNTNNQINNNQQHKKTCNIL